MKKSKIAPWANARSLLTCLFVYYALVISFIHYRLNWTPVALGLVDLSRFSEARARSHVAYLTQTIGHRQISSPGLKLAKQYLVDTANEIKARCTVNVTVEVDQHMVTGGISMSFMAQNFTNAYNSLSNVVMRLTPHRVDSRVKALLIAAHYDSAICSVGAADDASQVGVMLETARALTSGAQLPQAPIIFLFTGGEESVSQAAHGFVSSHPWMADAGAFINLEAMGGGGLPSVFQHTGAWTVEAYAAGARHPRGARVAQDVFDLGVIPGDSDYRMFSAGHYGSLPGIDVAILRDSAAYHTKSDTLERLRAGVLQEVGDNLMGAIGTFTAKLKQDQIHASGLSNSTGASDSHPPVLGRAVYFDVLGLAMFTYRDSDAWAIHNAPLILLSTLPFMMRQEGQLAQTVAFQVLYGARCLLFTILLSIALPAAFGAFCVFVTGVPMIWFSTQALAWAMFVPVALLGALLPWWGPRTRPATSSTAQQQEIPMHTQVHGCGLTCALIASLATSVGLQGSAAIFALSAYLAIALGFILNTATLGSARLGAALVIATVPILCLGCIAGTFVAVLMERMSLTGHVHMYVADLVAASLTGSSVLALSGGCLMPVLAYAVTPVKRQVVGVLLLVPLATAMWAHAGPFQPYTQDYPKRVLVSNIFETAVSGTTVSQGNIFMQGLPRPPPVFQQMDVVRNTMLIATTDSTPINHLLDPTILDGRLPSHGRDGAPLFPLDLLLHRSNVVLAAQPSMQPLVQQLPSIRLVNITRNAGQYKVELEMFSERPCWGVLNITGPLSNWSFGDTPIPTRIVLGAVQGGPQQMQHIARFTTESSDPVWPFWLSSSPANHRPSVVMDSADASAASSIGLRLELTVSYFVVTDVLSDVIDKLPPHSTPSWAATVYQSAWQI